MKVIAIITAAGSGSRFSNKNFTKPKQFLKIKGKEIIYFSLRAFQYCKLIDEIFVTSKKQHFDLIHKIISQNCFTKVTHLVEGGESRFLSVKNAFCQIKNKKTDIIVVHDAVRPNINSKFISSLIKLSEKKNALVPGIKITDTIKRAAKSFVHSTINRENLWQIQTPQIFKYKVLDKSYRVTVNKKNYTDEASLVESAGYKVVIAEGKKDNLKITTARDLAILKKLM